MKLWTVIGMSVAATIVVPTALALPPTAIQDSHDRADVPRSAYAGNAIQDSHDRADVPRSTYAGQVIQDSHDRADVPRTPALVVSRDGFDWGDAAIGVVSGMGFALLLAGLAVLTVVTRTKTRLSTR